jgi:hypothetical protein
MGRGVRLNSRVSELATQDDGTFPSCVGTLSFYFLSPLWAEDLTLFSPCCFVCRAPSAHVKTKGTIYLSSIRMVLVANKPVGNFFAFDMPLVSNGAVKLCSSSLLLRQAQKKKLGDRK